MIEPKYIKYHQIFLVLFIAIFLGYFLVTPSVHGYTDRAKTSELIVLGSSVKPIIDDALLNDISIEHIDANQLIEEGEFLSYMHISNSGEIFLYGESFGTFIKLTPQLKDNKVLWSCYGQPTKNMPSICKQNL